MHLFMALALFAANAPEAVVLKPVANMYAQPNDDAEVVSQAIYGTNMGVMETRPGWLRVRTPDDYIGWVPRESAPPGRRVRNPSASGAPASLGRKPVRKYLSRSQRHRAPAADYRAVRNPPGSRSPNRRTIRAGSKSACPTIAPAGCSAATFPSRASRSPSRRPLN